MGAPSMRPTRTTCSPASAPRGIRAERAAWSCAPATACTSTRRRSECSLRMCRRARFRLRPVSHGRLRQQRRRSRIPAQAGTVIEPFGGASTACTPLATSDRFVAPRWQHWNVGVQRRLYSRGMIDRRLRRGAGRSSASISSTSTSRSRRAQGDAAAEPGATVPGLRRDLHARDDGQEPLSRAAWPAFATRLARAGSATVNYTFSRNKADATYDNSEIDNPQNVLDKDAEFAAAGTDRTHIFTASYVYELPFARGATRGWRKGLLGGWQIAGITRIESGPAARLAGRQLQFRRLVYPRVRCGPTKSATPRLATRTGLLWFNPQRSCRRRQESMATRPSRRSVCPAVTSGTSPCRRT